MDGNGPPMTGSPQPGPRSDSNMGAIVGGIVGGVAVLVIVAIISVTILIVVKKKGSQSSDHLQPVNQGQDTHGIHNADSKKATAFLYFDITQSVSGYNNS